MGRWPFLFLNEGPFAIPLPDTVMACDYGMNSGNCSSAYQVIRLVRLSLSLLQFTTMFWLLQFVRSCCRKDWVYNERHSGI